MDDFSGRCSPCVIRKRCHGFSLVELLLAVAVIAILASILIPALSNMRGKANAAKCLSNIKNIGTAIFLYAADNSGEIPLTSNVEGEGWKFYQSRVWPYLLDYKSNVLKCPEDAIDLRSRQFEWSYGMPQSINPSRTFEALSNNSLNGLSRRVLLLESNTWAAAITYPDTKRVLASASAPFDGKIRDFHPGFQTHVLYADGHVESKAVKDITLWQVWPNFGRDVPLEGP